MVKSFKVDVVPQVLSWLRTSAGWEIEDVAKRLGTTAEVVKDILKKYPALVKEYRKYDADAWVVALAVEMTKGSQQTLIQIKRIVVTEEKLRGEKIRISYVCQKYGIESISIIEMFRIEGWKF
jgi:molybdopterin converting factor small subunit